VFTRASRELIQEYYPAYSGPVGVYALQEHVLEQVVPPLIDRYLVPEHFAVDLGCGRGTMVRRLSERARRAVGIDVDDSGFANNPGLELIKASIYDIPIGSGEVDFVTSRWVFEHLAKPQQAVREINRILRPGGHALIVVPNLLHPGMLLSKVLPLGVKQRLLSRFDELEEETVLETYYRANTERSLNRLFDGVGLEKRELHYVKDVSYWMFSQSLFRLAHTVERVTDLRPLQRFRLAIVAVYQKCG